MDFEDKTLERLFRSVKWARNNSLQLFEQAQKHEILQSKSTAKNQHTILYQLQCLITTTDAYYRRLTGHEDVQYGILLADGVVVKKDTIPEQDIWQLLRRQIVELEALLKTFDREKLEANVQDIQSIANHEYLHQGQMVVLFREADIALPERFRSAFDL